MPVGILIITLYLPGCHSLKDKRRCIRPIIARLHKEFNISVVEYDHQDIWQTSQLMIACAASRGSQPQKLLTQVINFCESHWPDVQITNEEIEIIQ